MAYNSYGTPTWFTQLRNFLFPEFSELNYLTLFWCLAMLCLGNPEIFIEAITSSIWIAVLAGAVVYLSIRMLGSHTFGHRAKVWIAFTYYAFLAFVTGVSLMSQLEAVPASSELFHRFNIVVTGAFLALAAIRLLATLLIFRLRSRKYEQLLTERFRDTQHTWRDFIVMFGASMIIMGLLRTQYDSTETLLLLSFAYTTLVHHLVFVRLPRLFGRS